MSLARPLPSGRAVRSTARARLMGAPFSATGQSVAWALAAVVAATVTFGAVFAAAGGSLGTDLPPFILSWQPAISPYALVAIATLGVAAVLGPALVASRLSPIGFAAAVTGLTAALRLALNLGRTGPSGWWEVYVVHSGSGEGRHEYLPGLGALRGGVGHFLANFDRIAPSLPTHPSGHPPGLLLTLNALGIGGPKGMAALTIGVGVLATPLLYLLARGLFAESVARTAAILFVFSPAALLYGATSADAMYATLGVGAAAALMARQPMARLTGAALLAVASFFSWALLAVGAWAVLLTGRRSGVGRALRLALACGAALAALYLLLYALTGFDPVAALRAIHDNYYAGIGGRRPYLFWLFGSPAAFLVALGLPIAWQAARSLGRGEATAVALAVVVAISAVLGYTKAETERIWLFMVPLACLAAARSQPHARLRLVLVLLVAQAIAVELLFNTIW
jgi:methylthioxylose transferase